VLQLPWLGVGKRLTISTSTLWYTNIAIENHHF
jgi:hypothetical protein